MQSLHNDYQATTLFQQYFFPLKSNVWLTLETLFYPLFWKWQKLLRQNVCNFWTKRQIIMKFWHLTFERWYYPEIIWIWQQWCHLYVIPETYWVMCWFRIASRYGYVESVWVERRSWMGNRRVFWRVWQIVLYYLEGIEKLKDRWTRCIELKGRYIEK